MKRCTRCEVWKALSDFSPNRPACRTCTNTSARLRHAANPERRRIYIRGWVAKNRDKQRASELKWQAAHIEQERNRAKERYLTNPQRQAEKSKQWAKTHKSAALAIKRKSQSRRLAKQRGVFVEDVDLDVLYERDKAICWLCKKYVERKDASRDHVIPVARRGAHSYDNVRLAHRLCNSRKAAKVPKGQPKLWQVIAV